MNKIENLEENQNQKDKDLAFELVEEIDDDNDNNEISALENTVEIKIVKNPKNNTEIIESFSYKENFITKESYRKVRFCARGNKPINNLSVYCPMAGQTALRIF